MNTARREISLKMALWAISLTYMVVGSLFAAPVPIERDDVLDVVVYDEPQLTRDYVVSPDGNISVPLVGVVHAEGLTLEQLAGKLTESLSKRMKEPAVTVSFKQRNRKDLVYVVGEVRTPGPYGYVPGWSISNYIGLAGGTTKDTNGASVLLVKGSNRKAVSLSSAAGDQETIEPGDTILVPLMPQQVYVLGEVAHPGTVQYVEGLRIVDAVSAAGGPTAEADLSNSVLYTRKGQTGSKQVDLAAMWKDPTNADNTIMNPGDTIVIERAPLIYIGGEVRQPGAFPSRSGYSIMDYIGLAGGFTTEADTKAVVITGRDGKVTQVDMQSQDLAYRLQGITIKSGDSIYVPKKVDRVYVGGEVRSAGDFEVRPGRKISDYVGMAGGLTERADSGHALLFRGSEKPSKSKVINLSKILSSKAEQENIELKPGDMVYVPQKFWANRIEDWGILGNLLTSAALMWRAFGP